VDGGSLDYEFFRSAIGHAQIASRICLQLGSLKTITKASILIDTFTALSSQLEEWYNLIPPRLKIDPRGGSSRPPNTARIEQLMYLHYGYHGSLMAIHAVFAYPWMVNYGDFEDKPAVDGQRISSTNAMIGAARNIILSSRMVSIDPACPHW
jgi:hypothetical protein